jgi:hypothetical protein
MTAPPVRFVAWGRTARAGCAAMRVIGGGYLGGLAELRKLAHGIYPASLQSAGLKAALTDAAHKAAIPTTVRSDATGDTSAEIEADVNFCCLEALQNATKHAGVTIGLIEQDGKLHSTGAGTGAGFDSDAAKTNSGLQNMVDRIGAPRRNPDDHIHPGHRNRDLRNRPAQYHRLARRHSPIRDPPSVSETPSHTPTPQTRSTRAACSLCSVHPVVTARRRASRAETRNAAATTHSAPRSPTWARTRACPSDPRRPRDALICPAERDGPVRLV